jgi:hypothetical protein
MVVPDIDIRKRWDLAVDADGVTLVNIVLDSTTLRVRLMIHRGELLDWKRR